MKTLFTTFLLLLTFCLNAETTPYTYTTIPNKISVPILTPDLKDMKMKKMLFPNGLEVVLISVPEGKKSGALMTVRTGTWNDFPDSAGIAHFTEHMLFLGTEKYPVESEFDKYISNHGGNMNAFTTSRSTNYFFSIPNDFFTETLDRFSQFFVAPLFNPSGVDRELQAIDQEHSKNIMQDSSRKYFVWKELAKSDHPFHKFSTGNKESLSGVSQKRLKEWYQQNYSASNMRVVIFSPLSLDEMTELAVKDFSDIPNRELMNTPISPSIYSDSIKGHFVYFAPIKDQRTLSLVWDMPSEFAEMLDTQIDDLVCLVLNNEGPNSLNAQLKKEQLIASMQCGAIRLSAQHMIFIIDYTLTDEGIHQLDHVIEKTFQQLALMKEKPLPDYFFNELHQTEKLAFQYTQRENLFDVLAKIAMLDIFESLETYPEKSFIVQQYDPELTQKFLQYLTPLNCFYTVMAPTNITGIKLDKKEPWMSIPYAILPVPSEKLQIWNTVHIPEDLTLPKKNPFIPDQLSVKRNVSPEIHEEGYLPTPKAVINNDKALIYYAQDQDYLVPKVWFSYEIKTPQVNASSANKTALGDLFIQCLKEALSEVEYQAKIAQLDYELKLMENGIKLTIDGYNDHADLLFKRIIENFKTFYPTEESFNTQKTLLERQYLNARKEPPYKQVIEAFRSVVNKNYSNWKQKSHALKKIRYEEFLQYIHHIFEKAYVEGMIYGNIEEQEAKKLSEFLLNSLVRDAYPKAKQIKKEILSLPNVGGPWEVTLNTRIQGNAAFLTIENPVYTTTNRAAQQILMQAISQPFYATLRTKQQTGYIVQSMPLDIEQHLFSGFLVQSNTHSPRDLLARFDLFLEGYLQELAHSELDESQFNSIKETLRKQVGQFPKNLSDMGELLQEIAFHKGADFEWIKKRLTGFNELTWAEFLEFTDDVLTRKNKRRFAILFQGSSLNGEGFQYLSVPSTQQMRKVGKYTSL